MDITSCISRQSSGQAGSSQEFGRATVCSAPDTNWSKGRRNHFIRQAVDGFFQVALQFYQLYAAYDRLLLKKKCDQDPQPIEMMQAWKQLLLHTSDMVGTERGHGPLWRLKDLCHRIWPRENPEQPQMNGVLVDWLIGSLFHEAMKLKEDLYLLSNYGSAAIAIGGVVEQGTGHQFPVQAVPKIVEVHALLGRAAAEISGQVERIGELFGKVNYHVRMILPELMENVLVIRLLAEREEYVYELWGESLEALFADVFAGQTAAGFCLAGASYLQGQWFYPALAMYKRASSSERHCDEAIVKVAQIEAILKDLDPGSMDKNNSQAIRNFFRE